MRALRAMEVQVAASPDGQVSLTDPDARAMATGGRGSGSERNDRRVAIVASAGEARVWKESPRRPCNTLPTWPSSTS
jgi:hypothetical protein